MLIKDQFGIIQNLIPPQTSFAQAFFTATYSKMALDMKFQLLFYPTQPLFPLCTLSLSLLKGSYCKIFAKLV